MASETPKRITVDSSTARHLPEGVILVDRTSPYGNPWYVGSWDPDYLASVDLVRVSDIGSHIETPGRAVEVFAKHVLPDLDLTELRGHDLACRCAADKPCHADVLLAVANGQDER